MDSDERAEEIDRIAKMAGRLYHELGLPIIPIHHPWEPIPPYLMETWEESWRGKRALGAWKKYQTNMPEDDQVRGWFFADSLFNVGIPTGVSSRVVVVDCDSTEAMTWAAGHLDPTPMVALTSEGLEGFRKSHHYYSRPEREVRNAVKIHTDIGVIALDIRGDGGYVLAPGSRHASGLIYEEQDPWTPDMLDSLPPLPDRLIELPKRAELAATEGYTDDVRSVRRARNWLFKAEPAVEGEGGDSRTFRYMCRVMELFPLSNRAIFDVFSEWNLRCSPPWTDPGLAQKVKNAREYGKNTRRHEGGVIPFPERQAEPEGGTGASSLAERVAGMFADMSPATMPPAATESHSAPDYVPQTSALPEVVQHPSSPMTGYVFLSKVERRRLEHVMNPYIPMGEITLVSGPGGRGKSLGVASIAASVSRGAPIAGVDTEQGLVLFFSAEDDVDSILLPRLDCAGADLSQIVAKRMHLGSQFALDSTGLAEIVVAVETLRPILVIIDPIANFMRAGLDMNRSNEVAGVLVPLIGLAKRASLAVMVVCHHNKSDDIMGSVQFWNSSRSVLSCYEDPVDRTGNRRYFAHRKTNYTRVGASLHYEIMQQFPDDEQRVFAHFMRTDPSWPADRLIAAQTTGANREQVKMAEHYLLEELRGGSRKAKDLLSKGRGIGLRGDTILTAKERMGIEAARYDDEKGDWYWSLA